MLFSVMEFLMAVGMNVTSDSTHVMAPDPNTDSITKLGDIKFQMTCGSSRTIHTRIRPTASAPVPTDKGMNPKHG